MPATGTAVLISKPGASVLQAWPQSPQTATDNSDLLQIADQGGQTLAKVNYAGSVVGPVPAGALTLTQVAVSAFTLTAAAVNSFVLTQVVGATGVYTGTITGGDSNAFVGKTVVVSGFSTSGNNGTFVITASSATTFTVAVTTQADETHAGAALVVGVTQVTFTGTITGGATNAFAGKTAIVAGFAAGTGANNGTYLLTGSSATTLVALATAANVAETHAGTAQVSGVSGATYTGTITGGGTNAFVGMTAVVTGFSNALNNVTFIVTASTATTLVGTTTTQVNETHAGSVLLSVPVTEHQTRIGRFVTRLAPGATLAQIFADAFTNPSLLDIVQVVNVGGNISYYLNYQGVATGS